MKTTCSAAVGPLLLSGSMAGGASGGPVGRPNILFIITDQQFAEVMSCRMGKEHVHTPAMDGLAQEGTLFTRAYSTNPLCMPARNSIFTGRYSHETGVTKNAHPEGGQLAPEFVCMGTYLKKAGYQTAYSGKWHLSLNEKDPSTHGFEILDRRTKLTPPEADNYDARVSHAAVEFLKRKQT
ncbi:MAG: sulfatase-like hydrolase/transferase, partial [Phycisphaeraceae bacterium]|nr:sulfatase-like hydrolase/transferase [Phycisphaeraceae bacterium]